MPEQPDQLPLILLRELQEQLGDRLAVLVVHGNLGRIGVSTEEVDTVLVDTVFLTHLHGDHVGWSLEPDGGPAFPGARYVTQEADGSLPNRTYARPCPRSTTLAC